jgi:hypothetical protein
MRTGGRFTVITAAAALALAVLGTDAAAVDSTVPDAAGGGIPEGLYRTPELTRDDLLAAGLDAGFSEADVNAFLDADGTHSTVQFGLLLADGGWTQRVAFDGDADSVGWRGTYEVVDEDTVIATDPCGPITYDYTVDGDVLTLDMVDDQCVEGGVGDQIAQTVIFESAPFTLQAPAEAAQDAEPTTYLSTSFVVPFEVTLPPWVTPEPDAELPNFVTWEGDQVDRGIRFLFPLNVYLPGETSPTDPPADYAAYLLGQEKYGAVFEDVVETTVDGLPATIVTGTTDGGHLDGSLGCQEEGLAAEDCFGLQPDLILRLAVIETDAGPLLVWVRDIRGADDRDPEYESFDEMLASLHFGSD